MFKDWREHDESKRGKTDEIDFGMKDANVWGHTHRIYFVGDNSFHFPWIIPKNFPRDALEARDMDRFIKFIDDFNPLLQYSFLEKLLYAGVSFLYLPAARLLHKSLRKDKYRSL